MAKLGIRKDNATHTHMVLCSLGGHCWFWGDYSLHYYRFIFKTLLVENWSNAEENVAGSVHADGGSEKDTAGLIRNKADIQQF